MEVEKEMSEGGIDIGTVGVLAAAGGGVLGVIYLGYKYFIEPGNLLLAQYRWILEDIYKETKKFLEQNTKLDPPIYGLTPGQEAILQAKERGAEPTRRAAEEELNRRGLDVNLWMSEIIIGILIVWAASVVLPKLIELVKAWRQKPEAESIQSSHGHAHVLFEIITNEFAGIGKLNIASGFNLTVQSYFTSFTQVAINDQIAFYNSLLPTLIPGSLSYIAALNMLSYLTFEISAAGLLSAMWQGFWWI